MERIKPNLLIDYSSKFQPSITGERVLRDGRIIDLDESPQAMIERMVSSLFSIEERFEISQQESYQKANEFGRLLDDKDCVMSTPVMTNAGRHLEKPLSACTVPPIDLRNGLNNVKQLIDAFHEDGMGTGFNIDDTDDPIGILKYLNDIAVAGAKRGNEERPVGNMATISIHHPKIRDIIALKVGADARGEEWKFNISINATDNFMQSALAGNSYYLDNGQLTNAASVLFEIVEAANSCGDPGLVFIDRLNRDNPTPVVGNYVSTAPCAEVGLAPGESCQFGYINIGNFIVSEGSEKGINYQKLENATRLMTRVLDNALELSIDKYAHPLNQSVMLAKRKIGIGICGLADMLVKLRIPYDSEQGALLSREIVGFINYFSKIESVELAKQRGSFGAMQAYIGNRYREHPGFLEAKYGNLSTKIITSRDWMQLGENIRKSGQLRNASTVALPPTGRSGLVIDASTGVEPLFSLVDYSGEINKMLIDNLKEKGVYSGQMASQISQTGRISEVNRIPENIKSIYKTALEIKPEGHLTMVEKIQETVDESISKTINVPSNSTSEDVARIYLDAYARGLKGITIFRTGSRFVQPRKLAQ